MKINEQSLSSLDIAGRKDFFRIGIIGFGRYNHQRKVPLWYENPPGYAVCAKEVWPLKQPRSVARVCTAAVLEKVLETGGNNAF